MEKQSISLQDRVYILSKIYSAISTYFAGWQAIPDVNIDVLYKNYVDKSLNIEDRFQFGLLMMEFIACLKNGSCRYADRFITEKCGGSLGFKIINYDGKWIVKNSTIEELSNCDVISQINGEDFESFYEKNIKYISASSDREAKTKFSNLTFLFPEQFTLKLADGREVNVVKRGAEDSNLKIEGRWIKEEQLAYIKIPSFSIQDVDQVSVNYVNNFKDAKALIIDLRDNDGGVLPNELLKALMDRSYRLWSESTPITLGFLKNYGQLVEEHGDKLSEAQRMSLGITRMFSQTSLIWPAFQEKPGNPIYKNKLTLLIDNNCSGACEDFIMPFKDNKRATILGEKTMGSTGVPYIYNFGNGISINILTKKAYFPDGSSFDGVGIAPDIGIHPVIEELKEGKDAVLMEAIRMTNMFIR